MIDSVDDCVNTMVNMIDSDDKCVKEMVNVIDQDGDGDISFNEFVWLMTR